MPSGIGSLRRLLLAPPMSDVTFAARGFPVTATAATRHLERIPQAVVCGFEWGIERIKPWELARRLDMVERELRGFACEGATMAATILDATGRSKHVKELMLGAGHPHLFLNYIGIGFAMARLPRPLWKRILADLGASPYHPTMSWLAVDGYGFDLAYFNKKRWIDEQRRPAPYPWQGAPGYFQRAVDQGIGRALWFVHGAQVEDVAAAVERFPGPRRADLWSGVGLAATFAGGFDGDDLGALRRSAGQHDRDLGVGVVFAAKARSFSGFCPAHTDTAIRALTGLGLESAVELADSTAVHTSATPDTPPYELWRAEVRARLPESAAPAGKFG